MAKSKLHGTEDLKFYAVRNKDGQWFRRKGYSGGGDSWVDTLRGARIYNKPGYARAIVTWFYKHYPEYGYADIVEFSVSETKIINVEKEVQDSIRKKEEREKKQEIAAKKRKFNQAKADYEKAQKDYEKSLK